MHQSLTHDSFLKVQRQVRIIIILFMIGLVLSGITAFPIQWQLSLGHEWMRSLGWNNTLSFWLERVYCGVTESYGKYPFLAYGTDWLAFAHMVIAVVFIGPLRDPVRNIWVIEFGMIACVGVFPLAFIAGSIREIPFFWQLIDCSFGIVGGILLYWCYRKIKQMEMMLV
jgi:hypothetical protein